LTARRGPIRLAARTDAPRLLEIYAPFATDTAVTFEEVPPALAEFERRIEAVLETAPWLVYEDDGRILAYAYASKHRDRPAYRWSVETSVYVDPGCQRRGVGRALYEALFARLRRQGFYNAYAGITLPNPASVGFHESFGFAPLGVYRGVGHKLGAWRDVGWWHLALQEKSAAPAPPLPLGA